jgi:hypothetical protein
MQNIWKPSAHTKSLIGFLSNPENILSSWHKIFNFFFVSGAEAFFYNLLINLHKNLVLLVWNQVMPEGKCCQTQILFLCQKISTSLEGTYIFIL